MVNATDVLTLLLGSGSSSLPGILAGAVNYTAASATAMDVATINISLTDLFDHVLIFLACWFAWWFLISTLFMIILTISSCGITSFQKMEKIIDKAIHWLTALRVRHISVHKWESPEQHLSTVHRRDPIWTPSDRRAPPNHPT